MPTMFERLRQADYIVITDAIGTPFGEKCALREEPEQHSARTFDLHQGSFTDPYLSDRRPAAVVLRLEKRITRQI